MPLTPPPSPSDGEREKNSLIPTLSPARDEGVFAILRESADRRRAGDSPPYRPADTKHFVGVLAGDGAGPHCWRAGNEGSAGAGDGSRRIDRRRFIGPGASR